MIKKLFLIVLMHIVWSNPCKSKNAHQLLVSAETGCAAVSMFCDIAGHTAVLKDTNKVYEPFYIARDIFSIANKLLYFYDYYKYGRPELHPFNRKKYYVSDRRDLLAQSTFLIQDMINLYKNTISFQQKRSQGVYKEIIRLVVINPSRAILPLLKGITAMTLSLSKLDESCVQRQYTLVAAQALLRLIDEYRELEEGSSYKKPLLGLIIVATIWLLYELKGYNDKAKTFGRCPLCTHDLWGYGYLTQLECGHSFCRACLFDRSMRHNELGRAQCPHHGCEHRLTDIEYNEEDFVERRDFLMERERQRLLNSTTAI